MIFRQHMLTLLFFMALPIAAPAEQFELPPDDNDVVGALTVVAARADETLLDLARRHGLGYEDIVRANPEVDTWLPGEGTEVLLPTRYVLPPGPRKGVILNLAEYRMYYFPQPKDGEPAIVMTYPMSIGLRLGRGKPVLQRLALQQTIMIRIHRFRQINTISAESQHHRRKHRIGDGKVAEQPARAIWITAPAIRPDRDYPVNVCR